MHHLASCLMLFSLVASGPAAAQLRESAVPSPAEQLTDPALARLPTKQLNEARSRRSKALAHYGNGRLHERNQRLLPAIDQFQRAWLWDPHSPAALDQLIPLCFQTEQAELGYRYARICLARGWPSVAPLRGIAFHAVLSETSETAWGVYQQAIQQATDDEADQVVGLHYDRTRLAYLDEAYGVALPSAEFLLAALQQPDQSEVQASTREDVWGDLAATYALLGEVLFENQRFAAAETAFRRAADAAPANTRDEATALLHFRLARVRHAQQQINEALRELDMYFAADSQAAGTSAYELAEKLPAADRNQWLAELEDRATDQPSNKTLQHFLGDYYLRHKQPRQAVAIFEQLAESRRDQPAQQQLVASYAAVTAHGPLLAALGRIIDRYGDLELVADQLDVALQQPALAAALLQEAQGRLADTKRRMLWQECVAAAHCCQRTEQPAKSTAFVAAAVQRTTDPASTVGALFALGMEQLMADQIPAAIHTLQAAIDVDPQGSEVADLHYYLALAYQLNDQFELALSAIDQAADTSKSLAVALRRARILLAADRQAAARTEFADAIQRFDDQRDDADLRLDLRDAKVSLAAICADLGDHAAAEKWLIEALCEFPHDAGASNDLGYLWADQQQHLQLARQMIEQAVAAEPDNVAFLDSLGWVRFHLGQVAEALPPLLKAAATSDAPDGVILDHLGDVLQRLGRHDEATAAWEKAVTAFEVDGQQDRIENVQQKLRATVRQE